MPNPLAPDLTGLQFPRWTKGACDPFRAANCALTHSDLTFSRRPPRLGFRTGSHEHALRGGPFTAKAGWNPPPRALL